MSRYYTRVCNFYYGKYSKELVNKKKTIPLNEIKEILTEKVDDLHKIAKALITYETLTGEEIENIINKNIYPKDKILEKSEDKDDQSSALGAMGLKPKIVH